MSVTSQFPCPKCGYAYSKAISTNRTSDGHGTRRQRTCMRTSCCNGFVTYEVLANEYAVLQAIRKLTKEQLREESQTQSKDAPPVQASN